MHRCGNIKAFECSFTFELSFSSDTSTVALIICSSPSPASVSFSAKLYSLTNLRYFLNPLSTSVCVLLLQLAACSLQLDQLITYRRSFSMFLWEGYCCTNIYCIKGYWVEAALRVESRAHGKKAPDNADCQFGIVNWPLQLMYSFPICLLPYCLQGRLLSTLIPLSEVEERVKADGILSETSFCMEYGQCGRPE